MLVSNCEYCKKSFKSYPSNHRRFCSGSCANKGTGRLVTHGGSYTSLYKIWIGIKGRCNGGNAIARKYYSEAGIRVCKKWSISFSEFKKWALETGYKPGLSLDRRENDKGYFPGNCRWATNYQQQVNKRKRKGGAETSLYKGVSARSNGI